MSEWWTYTLSDFLMFSPRTYWRLVELYNRDVWPAQLVALAAGLAAIALARSNKPAGGRLLAALLVAAWLWVGWAFPLATLRHHQLGCGVLRGSACRPGCAARRVLAAAAALASC